MNIKQLLKYGPFDIWGGGGWNCFEKKIVCFPTEVKKNKMSSTKLKISSFFIQ